MPHVLIVGQVHEAGLAILRERPGVTIEVLAQPSEPAVGARLADADGVLLRTSRLTRAMIEAAPRLRVVSRHGVGYDNVDVVALTERRIALAVAVGANTIAVAEHALAMLLALAKRTVAYDRAVREGRWQTRDDLAIVELYDKTLLLLGFGRVGREVARRAQAFGMRVHAYDPLVEATTMSAIGVRKADDLMAALALADAVSIHLPRSSETEGLIGEPALAALKPGAFVINTARGGILDERALLAALAEGRLRAAALDVLEQEPPPEDHPLLALDNLLLSPHVAGLSAEAAVRMAEQAAENLIAGLEGHLDPEVVVNPEVLTPAD